MTGDVAYWQIVLQKSQNAVRIISREKTKQATIADQCSLKLVTGIAREFDARWRSPPHNSSIAASTARKIYLQRPKKSFATQSALFGLDAPGRRCPLIGEEEKFAARCQSDAIDP